MSNMKEQWQELQETADDLNELDYLESLLSTDELMKREAEGGYENPQTDSYEEKKIMDWLND